MAKRVIGTVRGDRGEASRVGAPVVLRAETPAGDLVECSVGFGAYVLKIQRAGESELRTIIGGTFKQSSMG